MHKRKVKSGNSWPDPLFPYFLFLLFSREAIIYTSLAIHIEEEKNSKNSDGLTVEKKLDIYWSKGYQNRKKKVTSNFNFDWCLYFSPHINKQN